MSLVCDICGYKDTSALGSVVQLGSDGILRCKVCRHRLMYGRYIHDDTEEQKLFEAKVFTREYKCILEEYDGD